MFVSDSLPACDALLSCRLVPMFRRDVSWCTLSETLVHTYKIKRSHNPDISIPIFTVRTSNLIVYCLPSYTGLGFSVSVPYKPATADIQLVYILFKNSVRTSKRTPHFTITKINWLVLFKDIIVVYSTNRAKPINIKCSITDCQSRWFV
jgi:hypothetical protein